MQQTAELPTRQTSSTTTSDSIQSSQPNVVYGDIVERREPDSGYANVPLPSNNNREPNNAIYSELQIRDNVNHAVAPSGDLYAQVHKRLDAVSSL